MTNGEVPEFTQTLVRSQARFSPPRGAGKGYARGRELPGQDSNLDKRAKISCATVTLPGSEERIS